MSIGYDVKEEVAESVARALIDIMTAEVWDQLNIGIEMNLAPLQEAQYQVWIHTRVQLERLFG
jgi:hypothetical protein